MNDVTLTDTALLSICAAVWWIAYAIDSVAREFKRREPK